MQGPQHWRGLTRCEKTLILLFVLSLPLANPWVRGDGVGYYAYARALVVNGNLQFGPDWKHANASFAANRVANGSVRPEMYTRTGHVDNHFTVGPAVDWAPFLFLTHCGVRIFDFFGGSIPADGFSWPYVSTMALVTALAGFLGLFFSFSLARKYFPERWAFLATLGIWLASSLPVYMYFNPSWSHAHSAFAVALFLWYWDRTRRTRTVKQWILLGLISALMLNMYYPNAILLLAPILESAWLARESLTKIKVEHNEEIRGLAIKNTLFAGAAFAGLLPTFATRWIIYGNPFSTGYVSLNAWHWTSPDLVKVLFSSDHGLFSWTPILILAFVGLIFLARRERELGIVLSACALMFYFFIASYPDWDGISSFGNRFFVSLTPIFVLGLTAFFTALGSVWRNTRRAMVHASAIIGILIVWNAGLIFQWGMHLIPDRGTFSWNEMIQNQFYVVPGELTASVERYFTRRGEMMQGIEKRDLRQIQQQEARQEKGGS